MANRALCGCLFWTKALIALLIALGGLGYQAYLIYKLYSPSATLPSIDIPNPGSSSSTACYYDKSLGKARLEPPAGTFIMGFSLDWSVDLPTRLGDRINKRPALFNSFAKINATAYEKDIISWQAQEAGKVGAMLEITLQPMVPMDQIPTDLLWDFSVFMRTVNSKSGVPVLLRFGHEMNGNWMPYGMRPLAYKQAFATLSSYIHMNTNMTAMLWSPNVGNTYPFGATAGTGPVPAAGTDEFKALDTNGDNLFTEADDPYLPYFPGAEWVDWVGISVYNYEYDANHQVGTVPLTVFTSTTNQMSITGADDTHNFYQRFVASTNKPFIFSETGSAYQTGGNKIVPTDNQLTVELASKRSWWNAILQGAIGGGAQFTQMRAAVWFEEQKTETDSALNNQEVWRDYRITYNATVRDAFLADLASFNSKINWAGNLKVACNGAITIQ
nr:hypothetical protein HK105_000226 [Polyrhizophydium stewartii]